MPIRVVRITGTCEGCGREVSFCIQEEGSKGHIRQNGVSEGIYAQAQTAEEMRLNGSFDRKIYHRNYMREYMRRRRAKGKEKPDGR
jgi:hypothetical protein